MSVVAQDVPGEGTGPWDRTTLMAYLVSRYQAGCSLMQLSAETQRSFGHVRRLLLDAGVVMRPRGGSRPRTA